MMLVREKRRERRQSFVKFVRRTIVFRFLLTPFVRDSFDYGFYGVWKEIYVFGIRITGVRT